MSLNVRFDDFKENTGFRLLDPIKTIETSKLECVSEIFEEVQELIVQNQYYCAGFVSYEAAPALDPSLRVMVSDSSIPLVWFTFFENFEECHLVESTETFPFLNWELTTNRTSYENKFFQAKELIELGHTYQINLTSCYETSQLFDPYSLYKLLATNQDGRLNCFIETDTFAIASASPELFFKLQDNKIICQPMKGTIERGRFLVEDNQRFNDLRHSAKDISENLMIVDLIRNDVGKIAQIGSVAVRDAFHIEPLKTLWQMTSVVEGRITYQLKLFEIFQALFPCGSITGVPKKSAMDIIYDLEDQGRGLYCGAIGFISPSNSPLETKFSVAIRTAVTDKISGRSYYGSGGGITDGSEVTQEYNELRSKSKILEQPELPDGLFETFRFEPSLGFKNIDRHLARLAFSMQYFRFQPLPTDILDRLEEMSKSWSNTMRIRLEVSKSGEVTVTNNFLSSVTSYPNVAVDTNPILSTNILNFHKITDRSMFDDRAKIFSQFDDVILINEKDEITQSLIANVAVKLEGKWFTPPISCGLLPGIERQRLIEKKTLFERIIKVDELKTSSEIALVSSLRGWRKATLFI